MFYAIVDATKLGYEVTPDEARELAVLGEKVRLAAREQLTVVHPENPGISGVSIVQLNRPFQGVGQATRNTCIVAPGRSDRSPTGTGTCARMAVLHARGQMKVGDHMYPREHHRLALQGHDRGRNQDRRPPRHPAAHRGARLDHRLPHLLPGCRRPLSAGLCGGRQLGRDGDDATIVGQPAPGSAEMPKSLYAFIWQSSRRQQIWLVLLTLDRRADEHGPAGTAAADRRRRDP